MSIPVKASAELLAAVTGTKGEGLWAAAVAACTGAGAAAEWLGLDGLSVGLPGVAVFVPVDPPPAPVGVAVT
jgi:hypothetical protein